VCLLIGGRKEIKRKKEAKVATLMSFGGFLEAKQSGGGGRIVSDIPYSNGSNHSNDIMPSGAISQPRLATPTLAKSMFNSPGLSLALVRIIFTLFPSLLLALKGFFFFGWFFFSYFGFLVLFGKKRSKVMSMDKGI